jgi:hypothetical protein
MRALRPCDDARARSAGGDSVSKGTLEKRDGEKGDPRQCQACPQDQRKSNMAHGADITPQALSSFGNSICLKRQAKGAPAKASARLIILLFLYTLIICGIPHLAGLLTVILIGWK